MGEDSRSYNTAGLFRGAPADPFRGSIRPFTGEDADGAHFCAEDWHVILAADIEGGDASFTHNDAERIMQGLDLSFTLDGTALPTTRSAIKRMLNPELFGVQRPTTSNRVG